MIKVPLKELYYSILRIRRVEEAFAAAYAEQEMRCPMHLSVGQEAPAAGVCAALERDDAVFSNHRAHAHYLAKGGDLNALVAELYGRATGCAGGYGGSMHLFDAAAGFMGSTPIVGGTVPVACGYAWSSMRFRPGRVTCAFFGDGCMEEGVMHETLNFAALKKLPLLFVCENNGYSVFTPLRLRQPDRPLTDLARAHGWGVFSGDGNDVVDVFKAARSAVTAVRGGKGPQFLEFFTHRWLEHCGPNSDDHVPYREENELARWKARCPLKLARELVLREKISTEEELEAMEENLRVEIAAAIDFARKSPPPDPSKIAERLYAAPAGR